MDYPEGFYKWVDATAEYFRPELLPLLCPIVKDGQTIYYIQGEVLLDCSRVCFNLIPALLSKNDNVRLVIVGTEFFRIEKKVLIEPKWVDCTEEYLGKVLAENPSIVLYEPEKGFYSLWIRNLNVTLTPTEESGSSMKNLRLVNSPKNKRYFRIERKEV